MSLFYKGQVSPNRKDLAGKTFGRLTVLEYHHTNKHKKAVWRCVCSCGKEVLRTTAYMDRPRRTGLPPSCGCHPEMFKISVGDRFGEWVVVSRAQNNKEGSSRWNCLCSCGTKRAVSAKSLSGVRSLSCGCLGATEAERSDREIYNRATRLRKFGLTLDDFYRQIERQRGICPICQLVPVRTKQHTFGLVLDHDHETGLLRGFICPTCNTALAYLKDDPEVMRRAALYVEGKIMA